jgi:hypothetical protein
MFLIQKVEMVLIAYVFVCIYTNRFTVLLPLSHRVIGPIFV